MKRIFVFSFLCVLAILGFGQHADESGETEFLDRYKDHNFTRGFTSLVESDDVSNYYILDFSKLPSRFERIYFMNLSFSMSQVVNIGFEPARNIAGFKAHKSYHDDVVVKVFDDLLEKTETIAGSWTRDQKEAWLKENDKYK